MNYAIKILLLNAFILALLLFGTFSTFIISNHLEATEGRKNYPEAIEKIKASEDINWLRKSFAATVKLRHSTNAGLIKWHNKSFYFLLILSGLSVLNIYLIFNLKNKLISKYN